MKQIPASDPMTKDVADVQTAVKVRRCNPAEKARARGMTTILKEIKNAATQK
jgi:hypothetical protein